MCKKIDNLLSEKKLKELLETSKLSELIRKKDPIEEKKHTLLFILAIIGAVADGVFPSYQDAADKIISFQHRYEPVNHAKYEKKYEKCSLSKADIPLLILIYAIAMDNPEESSTCGQISIDKIMEDKKQVGKYFGIRYSKLIEMLMEAENKQLLTLNNNFGNRHISGCSRQKIRFRIPGCR